MDMEYFICQKKGVKVYKLPPMQTNQGHLLDSWKREDKLAEVNLKVVARGYKLTVELRNPDETLFAAAPLPDKVDSSLVRCTDSTRGYALKLVDPKGKSVWVGISFGERNDSFDFHESINDFNQKKDMELNPEKYSVEKESSSKDWSLKSGDKISIDIGNKKTTNSKPTSNSFKLMDPNAGLKDPNAGKSGGSSSGGLSNNTNKQTSNDPFDFSNFGNNLGNSKPIQNTQNTQKNTNLFDDFSDFGSFGSSKPQQQQQQQKKDTKVDNMDFFDFGGNSGNSNTVNKQTNNVPDLWDMGTTVTNTSKPQQQQQQKINYQNVNLLD